MKINLTSDEITAVRYVLDERLEVIRTNGSDKTFNAKGIEKLKAAYDKFFQIDYLDLEAAIAKAEGGK